MIKRFFTLIVSICFLLTAPLAVAQRGPAPVLPDGQGKDLVTTICSACHSPSTIMQSAGYSTAEEWRDVFSTMIKLGDEQANSIATYLAEHFPEDTSRRPKLIAGNTQIEITEWTAPTLGQRVRDPAEAPDGAIWWTGMWASLTGRLDPETGAMTEYKLPPAARPHSIVPDKEGNIWYTGNSNATIGKLNPKTGLITEYKTQAQDPHSAIWHPNGNLYFTAQRSAMMGRLNPITGDVKEINVEPNPYGIKVDSRGTVWIAFNGTNKIGSIDPNTMEVRYFEIPDQRTRVRRLDLDSKGMVWFVNSTMGKIGRLNPQTGEIKQWDSPSGSESHPYSIAVIDDVIWYNESGMRPDALVRFDPANESFESWAVPSGVGIIRNTWVTQDGNLLIHQSSSNRIGLVKIPPKLKINMDR